MTRTASERLAGKVALVTGGAQGLGAAMARLFAVNGAEVVLTDIQVEAGEALAAEIGPAATFIEHDVAREGSWDEVLDRVRDDHGRLDVLVNNAGTSLSLSLMQSSVADLDRLFGVNVRSVFMGMRAATPLMKESGGGSIINVASLAALNVIPDMVVYGTTKWAVRGMSKHAARELAVDAIRVNTVYPGVIDTPMLAVVPKSVALEYEAMTPLGRLGHADDVASTALFLASDESAFVTGGDFVVDGGLAL